MKLAVYHGDNMAPEEWEQDPWCPTHPDMTAVRSWLSDLADKWENEADDGEDRGFRKAAHATRLCASELRAALAAEPAEVTPPAEQRAEGGA